MANTKIANLRGPTGAAGAQGNPGATGATGAAATIAAGTTATLAPGNAATVSNAGTSSAAVFNFGIPQGVAGPTGATGPTGSQGPQGIQGPTAVSTDAGNIATLGSDNLILVPQSSLWNMRVRSFNAVGNPTFEVDQRNVGNAVSFPAGAGLFSTVIDRWGISKPGTGTMAVTARQLASASSLVWPGTNFRVSANYLQVTLTAQQAALAAGDQLQINQYIEGPCLRELINDVHSISLLAMCSQPLSFAVALRTSPSAYSLCKLCTIPTANVWTLIQLPNLPVWTSSGTWPITPGVVGCQLSITLAAGSTFMPPANDTWQTGNFIGAVGMTNFASLPVNTVFNLAFVQHEPGPLCSTPMDCPFTQNYDNCLRHFQKTYPYNTAIGTVNSAGVITSLSLGAVASIFGPFRFFKPMAKIPTMTFYNHATGAINSVRDNSGVDHASPTATAYLGETGFAQLQFTTALIQTNAVFAHYTADTGW